MKRVDYHIRVKKRTGVICTYNKSTNVDIEKMTI